MGKNYSPRGGQSHPHSPRPLFPGGPLQTDSPRRDPGGGGLDQLGLRFRRHQQRHSTATRCTSRGPACSPSPRWVCCHGHHPPAPHPHLTRGSRSVFSYTRGWCLWSPEAQNLGNRGSIRAGRASGSPCARCPHPTPEIFVIRVYHSLDVSLD